MVEFKVDAPKNPTVLVNNASGLEIGRVMWVDERYQFAPEPYLDVTLMAVELRYIADKLDQLNGVEKDHG